MGGGLGDAPLQNCGDVPPWMEICRNVPPFKKFQVNNFLSTHKWPEFEIILNSGWETKKFRGAPRTTPRKFHPPGNFHKPTLLISLVPWIFISFQCIFLTLESSFHPFSSLFYFHRFSIIASLSLFIFNPFSFVFSSYNYSPPPFHNNYFFALLSEVNWNVEKLLNFFKLLRIIIRWRSILRSYRAGYRRCLRGYGPRTYEILLGNSKPIN